MVTDRDALRQVSRPYAYGEDVSRDVEKLMSEYKSGRKALGLSGPQVGIMRNLFVIKIYDKSKFEIVEDKKEYEYKLIVAINPEIIWASGTKKSIEGCESLGDDRYEVKRATRASVKYLTPDNLEEYTFMLMKHNVYRIFKHEYDHLLGVLLCDIGKVIIQEPRYK